MSDPPPSLPPSSRHTMLRGIAGSPGIAIGRAVVLSGGRSGYARRFIDAGQIDHERARFREAVAKATLHLREMAERVSGKPAEASILEAYVLMVGDETLAQSVDEQIGKDRRNAEWAVAIACEGIAARLASLSD